MKKLLQQRFFRLLSEYPQRKASVDKLSEAINELATHLADFSTNEQDNSLVEWRIKYPEQFKPHFNKQPFSPLYLADKTNLIDIMEIISSLFLSKHIVYKNGKPAFLSDFSKAFEWVFNIQLKDYHQKHEDVIKRKLGKITEFLNGLSDLIRNEHDKKGYR